MLLLKRLRSEDFVMYSSVGRKKISRSSKRRRTKAVVKVRTRLRVKWIPPAACEVVVVTFSVAKIP
jgi:hypothetical protein